MNRALLWKEWREQRSLVLGALALAAVLPGFLLAGAMAGAGNARLHEMAAVLLPLYALLVWPLFAAATAGTAFAADMGDGSMKLLLSRPVSRARVWLIKVGVALAAFAVVVAGTALVAIGFIWLSAANNAVFWNTMRRDFVDSIDVELLILAVPFLFLFGCSVYCSTFAKRPLVAALGGLLVAGCMAGVIGLVWSALVLRTSGLRNSGLGQLMIVVGAYASVPLATVWIYGAAFRAFRRGDIFDDAARRRAWRPLLATTVVVLIVGPVPAAYVGVREMASVAAHKIGGLGVVGDGVVVPELSPGGFTTALVLRPLDGGASSVLVAENATNPALSPDGEWVVFAAHGGYLAGLSSNPHLRAVRTDGADDHAISGALPGWVWHSWSASILVAPDNDHVAFVGYGDALLTSISGGPESSVELSLTENGGIGRAIGGVIGWAASDPVELLYYGFGDRLRRTPAPGGSVEWSGAMRKTELLAYDPATGESRLVRAFAGRQYLAVWGTSVGYSSRLPSRPWAWLPVWLDNGEGAGLHLVDVVEPGGEMIDLTPSACRNWGLSASGTRFVYTSCGGELRTGDARADVRIRDLVSGTDERFAVLEGYALAASGGEMFPSPDDSRLLLYTRRGYAGQRGTHLLSSDGTARMLAGGFVPLGWRNDAEAILARSVSRDFELRVVNVETGRVQVVFP